MPWEQETEQESEVWQGTQTGVPCPHVAAERLAGSLNVHSLVDTRAEHGQGLMSALAVIVMSVFTHINNNNNETIVLTIF